MELQCQFRSFDPFYVQQSLTYVQEVAHCLHISWRGPHSFPLRRRRFTLLRAPHIHKKAREQFEWRTHRGGLTLCCLSPLQLRSFFAVLGESHLPGVECTLRLRWRDHLP